MTRVLAAVDGSPVSIEVLRAAVVLADMLGAQAEALYVGGTPAHDLQRLAAATGVRLTHRDGSATQVLPRVLGEPDVLMGVVGTSGSGSTKVAQGRTAASVMSGANKPLLVVPPGSFPPRRRHLHRALVPLDGCPESADAVEPVLRLLGEAGVDLVVVHVFDQATVPSFWDQPQHAAPAWEREFLHRNLPFQRARLHVCQGQAAGKVVQTAYDERTDLVVVGWSQDLSAGHARTVQDLLATGGLPVLLVPAAARTVVAGTVVAGTVVAGTVIAGPVIAGPVIDLTQVSQAASRAGSGGAS
jgi:nucleotide-binding universal stress UspA family protein